MRVCELRFSVLHEDLGVMAGLRVRSPQVSRSTRMPLCTIRARLGAKHQGPSRVQDRDGYSCRPPLCIALKCAHRDVWRLRPEEGAGAAHKPSPAPIRRWCRSRDAQGRGRINNSYAIPGNGFSEFIPNALDHFRVGSQFHVGVVNFFRPDHWGQWNAISMQTSQVGQNDPVPRDIYVNVRGHVSPSYQRA